MPKLSNKEKYIVMEHIMRIQNTTVEKAISIYAEMPQKKRSKLLVEVLNGKAKKNI